MWLFLHLESNEYLVGNQGAKHLSSDIWEQLGDW